MVNKSSLLKGMMGGGGPGGPPGGGGGPLPPPPGGGAGELGGDKGDEMKGADPADIQTIMDAAQSDPVIAAIANVLGISGGGAGGGAAGGGISGPPPGGPQAPLGGGQ